METEVTQDFYGVHREGIKGGFARNCLLARSMVERGFRVVSLFPRTWNQYKNLRENFVPSLPKSISRSVPC